MKRILIRGGKHPFQAVRPLPSLAANTGKRGTFSRNSGNNLYFDAVYRSIYKENAKITTDGWFAETFSDKVLMADYINQNFDVFIVPLASAFRDAFYEPLYWLNETIKRLTIPVVVTSSGVEYNTVKSDEIEEVGISDDTKILTKKFVKEVLDRSNSIGVRGNITKDFLMSLGFPEDKIDVVGCPSLYSFRDKSPEIKKGGSLSKDSKIALNLYPERLHDKKAEEFLNYHMNTFENLDYITQDFEDLTLLLWGNEFGEREWNLPTNIDHKLYKERKMKFYLDSYTWVDDMKNYDFVLGPRLHGTIASLLAGTPAFLTPFDTRTAELAEFHKIPYKDYSDLTDKDNAFTLYEQANYDEYNSLAPEHFENYKKFLEKNGIEHNFGDSYEEYKENTKEFDEKIKNASFAKPVLPFDVSTQLGLDTLEHLQWLRGDIQDDISRKANGAFEVEDDMGTPGYNDNELLLSKRLYDLDKRLARLERNALFSKLLTTGKRMEQKVVRGIRGKRPAKDLTKNQILNKGINPGAYKGFEEEPEKKKKSRKS